MILGVHHTSITTRDIDALVDFYCDQLGFELTAASSWNADSIMSDRITGLPGGIARMAMLSLGNSSLEIFEYIHPTGERSDRERAVCTPGVTHICLEVSDIEAEYARLAGAGVSFHCPPQEAPGVCKATYGRDPDGNIFELIEVAPDGAFDLHSTQRRKDPATLRAILAASRSLRR